MKRRRRIRLLAALAAVPVLAVAMFCLAAWAGSAIPRNPGWREPTRGITIMVADNGLHTELVLPVVSRAKDWRETVPALALPRRDGQYYTHVAIGWGEREIFLSTPSWSDLRAATALRILLSGGDAVMRFTPFVRPAPDRWYRPLRLRPAEYRRLVDSIEKSLPRRSPGGERQRLAGFDPGAFNYRALGHYTVVNGCNQWTSDRLADAGVETGWWTPFAGGVMKWVPEPGGAR